MLDDRARGDFAERLALEAELVDQAASAAVNISTLPSVAYAVLLRANGMRMLPTMATRRGMSATGNPQ
jgi:hypothetical protein